ncbi:hypothetical protein AN958_01905 [Leucoagaricus sp. SymC.cos]|nr:hypothetical protein AN958_01905 [Leucoagaricus sp. SymC.cos]
MTDSQPVIITYLKVSVQDPRETRPILVPEFQEILQPLQKAASQQADILSELVTHAQGATKTMLDFINALPLASTGSQPPMKLQMVSFHGEMTAEKYEEAEQGMEEVCKIALSAVEKLKAILSQEREASVFTPENSRVVNELIQAAHEGSSLLRQASQYWRETEKHFNNYELFREQSPPTEEIDMIRQRWIAFTKGLDNFKSDLGRISSALERGGGIYEARRLGRLWARFGNRTDPDQRNRSTQPRAILDVNTLDAEPNSPSLPADPPPKFYKDLDEFFKDVGMFEELDAVVAQHLNDVYANHTQPDPIQVLQQYQMISFPLEDKSSFSYLAIHILSISTNSAFCE